jgi:hypothetical protein
MAFNTDNKAIVAFEGLFGNTNEDKSRSSVFLAHLLKNLSIFPLLSVFVVSESFC